MPGLDAHRLDSFVLDGFQRTQLYDPRRDAKIFAKLDGDFVNSGDGNYSIQANGTDTPIFVAGKKGQCYSAKNATSITLDPSNTIVKGSFTAAMWLNCDMAYSTFRRVLWYADNNRYMGIDFNSSFQYVIAISNVGGTDSSLWPSFNQTFGWLFLVWKKYSTGEMFLQANNKEYYVVSRKATSLTNTITTPLTISHTTYQYDGLIDEVCVWDRILTDEELRYLYNNGLGR